MCYAQTRAPLPRTLLFFSLLPLSPLPPPGHARREANLRYIVSAMANAKQGVFMTQAFGVNKDWFGPVLERQVWLRATPGSGREGVSLYLTRHLKVM